MSSTTERLDALRQKLTENVEDARAMRKEIDALRHLNTSSQNQLPLPFVKSDMGGITGGERERRLEQPTDVISLAHRRAGLWGQYTEPEVFWHYWETVEAVDQAQRWNDAVRHASYAGSANDWEM